MDRHIFRYDSANQTILKFALTITIVGHSLTTGRSKGVSTWLRHCGPLAHNAHLIIYYARMHARGCNIPNDIYAPAFLSRLASSTYQLYYASKALSCFVPMVKHHQDPHKHRPQTAHALRNHPRLISHARHAE